MHTELVRTKLQQQEAIIERGYIESGKALAVIRDEKLYRLDYRTFEAYVKERWDITRQHAYRLIDANLVVQEMSLISDKTELMPTNINQAIELKKVEPEKRIEIMQKAKQKADAEDRAVTTKDIAEVQSQPKHMDDDEEIALPVKSKPLAIENGRLIRSIINLVNEAKRELDAIEKGPGLEELCSARRSIERELNSVKASLVTCIPHSVCPRCKGKRCTQCGNLGWCNSVLAKSLMEAV